MGQLAAPSVSHLLNIPQIVPLLSRWEPGASDRQPLLFPGDSTLEPRLLRNKNVSRRFSFDNCGTVPLYSLYPSDMDREKIPAKKIGLTSFLFPRLSLGEALPAKQSLADIFVPKWNLGTRGINNWLPTQGLLRLHCVLGDLLVKRFC